jgi:hypothetical protein
MNPPNDVNQSTPEINSIIPPVIPIPQPANPNFNQTIPPNPIDTNSVNPLVKPKPKHLVLKWVGAIVGIFILLGIVVGALAFALTAAPVKVANEQFNDIRQNNLQAAYDLFSDSAQSQTSFSDFQSIVLSNHLSDAQTASISFSGRQVNGDKAELDGKITVNNSSAGLRYVLVKTNGAWKVSDFAIIPQ